MPVPTFNRFAFACLTAFSLWMTAATAQISLPASTWDGEYTYLHQAGRGAGGNSSMMEYSMAIASSGKQPCTISIVGLQINEDILCAVQLDGEGQSITVQFRAYATGKLTNQNDVVVYKVGAPLLKLSKDSKGQLITTWLQLLAKDEPKRSPGKYFTHKPKRN
jgi:phage terminase large subunit-like protein